MTNYRVFYFENNCFTDTEEFGADGDVQASIIAKLKAGRREFELWHDDERVIPAPHTLTTD